MSTSSRRRKRRLDATSSLIKNGTEVPLPCASFSNPSYFFCSSGVAQTTSIEFSMRCQLARPARRPSAKTRQSTHSDCEEGFHLQGLKLSVTPSGYPLPLRTHPPDERLCNSLFVEHPWEYYAGTGRETCRLSSQITKEMK